MGNMTMDFTEIKIIIKEYHEQLYANKITKMKLSNS